MQQILFDEMRPENLVYFDFDNRVLSANLQKGHIKLQQELSTVIDDESH